MEVDLLNFVERVPTFADPGELLEERRLVGDRVLRVLFQSVLVDDALDGPARQGSRGSSFPTR